MKLLVLAALIYLVYIAKFKPMLSNKKLVDTKEWDQEEEEFVEYEEVE